MEVGLWRVDGQPVRLTQTGVPLEKTLEDLIERDPDILGDPLLIIGRQVPTAYGKVVDRIWAPDIQSCRRRAGKTNSPANEQAKGPRRRQALSVSR